MRKKNTSIIIFLFLALSKILYAQTSVDSLEIYNPFTQSDEIRRIVKTGLSILNGDNKLLLSRYQEQIESARKNGSIEDEAAALNNSGYIYFKSASYHLAISYYLRALEIYEALNEPAKAAGVEIEIGRAYYFADLVPIARDYILNAYQTLQRTNDEELIGYANYAIGTVTENPARAEAHFKKALEIQKLIVKKKPYDNKAKENLAKYLNANHYYDEALKMAEEIKDNWLIVLYLNNIGVDKSSERKYSEAVEIFKRAVKICKAARLKGLLKNTYVNLSTVYRLMGDWQQSGRYKEIAAFIVESLYLEEFTIQTSELKVKYEAKKKDLENELLRKEQIIMKSKISDETTRNYILSGSIIIVSLFLLLMVLNRKKLRNSAEMLDRKNNEILQQKEVLEYLNTALVKSEENLNTAQAATHLANWEWDLNSDEITFSNQLPKIFGIDSAQLRENFKVNIIAKLNDEDKYHFRKYFSRNSDELLDEEREYRILNGNGVKFIHAKRIVMKDDSGKVSKVFGTVQDITENKKTEEARVQLAAQRSFTKQLLMSQEEERKRIAGELHDSLGQDILLIKNRAQLGLQGENLDSFTIEQLNQINNSSSDMINMVRDIAFDLRPAHLERLGLTDTVVALINRVFATTKINIIHNVEIIDNLLNEDEEINFFRIIQESISNIVKHSEAKNAEINILKMDSQLFVEMNDDGKGFEYNTKINSAYGFGLNSIKSRTAMLNGKIEVHSQNGIGTKIKITIPIKING